MDQEQVEVFNNDIEAYIAMFCDECKPPISDMVKEPQSRWNACLMYVGKHVFYKTDKLKLNKYIDDDRFLMKTNCGMYDLDKVDEIADIYIYLCSLYDKECSIVGFSILTGISRDTLQDWGADQRKLSPKAFYISQKLRAFREESLSNKLTTVKNPVGVLAILNRHYQWNLPGVSKERSSGAALTADELPQLCESGKQLQDVNCVKIQTIEESSK